MKLLLICLLALGPAFAADEVSVPAPALKSFFGWTPTENLPSWLQLGGQIRGRFEFPSGTALTNSAGDGYYASRIRVDFGVKPLPWLNFFAQTQDTRTAAYNQPVAPATLYNPFDLRQGYVEVGTSDRFLRLRAGRQELAFGSERLIGPADWTLSKTFDALDLTVGNRYSRVDFIAGSLVQIDPSRFDRHKPGEHFYGAYGSFKNLPGALNVEPYILFKQTLYVKSEYSAPGDALVASPGVRVYGKTPGRFYYSLEFILQRGSYSADQVRAYAQSYAAGWTVSKAAWKPRLSIEYTYASGDSTLKDGRRGTFDQFYPSNHSNYGMIDQFGWKNLINSRAGFDCVFWQKLKIRTDVNQFYLASLQDGLYNSSGASVVLNRKATSNHIGWETNTVAIYQWTKVWRFGAGYGRLFAGGFLKQSNVTYGYTYPFVFFTRSF